MFIIDFMSAPVASVSTPTPDAPESQRPGSAHLAMTLSALCGAGGIAGYVRASSMRSLIAGGLCGGAFALSSSLISTPGSQERGFRLATGTSAVLMLAMGARFARTGKVMPVGVLAAVSAASTAYHGNKWLEWSDQESD